MNCTTLQQAQQKIDGGGMFGNAPKALWSRWFDADDLNRVRLACRTFVVNTGQSIFLVDAGIGSYMDPKLALRYGLRESPATLPEELAAIGIAEDDVDFVILSHLHFDHAGGLIPAWPAIHSDDWAPFFPNAQYVMSQTQYERAVHPHPRDRASYIPALPEKLKASDRLILLSPGDGVPELDGAVSFSMTDGHTPGLLNVLVRGEKESVFFSSDLIPGTAWLHLPIVTGFERYPEQLINDKRAILETAVAENWLIVYPHDPNVAASRVTLNEKGKYEAIEPMPVLENHPL